MALENNDIKISQAAAFDPRRATTPSYPCLTQRTLLGRPTPIGIAFCYTDATHLFMERPDMNMIYCIKEDQLEIRAVTSAVEAAEFFGLKL